MLHDGVPHVPPPATTGSDEEDDSDSSTKPIRSEKKKNPASLFQTGGDPPKEKKSKKKGESPAPVVRWRVVGAGGARGGAGEPGHGEGGYDQWCWCGPMPSLVLGFGEVRLFSPPSLYPFLPAAPPKAAESEEETLETPQKNSNKKGKGKKSKKVQKTPQSRGGSLVEGGRSGGWSIPWGDPVQACPQSHQLQSHSPGWG